MPDETMGDVIGDLNSRRGRVLGVDPKPPNQVIRAEVPMEEMLTYASTLKSLTSDRASYTMEFDHYYETPSHVRDKIVAEAEKEKEQKAG